MRAGYFDAAWNDVRNSPGLPGKLFLLVAVSLIPVFGWIVVYGYLLGWARDLAWGIRAPLPQRIFENADGELYRRGFFAMVIAALFGLLPLAYSLVFGRLMDIDYLSVGFPIGGATSTVPVLFGFVPVAFVAISILATMLSWAGMMRMSIYRRLAPGLQVSRIWAMVRHDAGGILRIVGMSALIAVAAGVVALLLLLIVSSVTSALLVALIGDPSLPGPVPSYDSGLIMLSLFVIASAVILYVLIVSAIAVFAAMMVMRALGYWMQQFDVPRWRGQDDPMPFELIR